MEWEGVRLLFSGLRARPRLLGRPRADARPTDRLFFFFQTQQTVSRARADERASDAEEKRERWDKLYLEMDLAGATSAPVSVDSGWEVAR